MNPASSRSFAQDLSFERGEDRQQSGHSSTGGRGQIEGLGQEDEPEDVPVPGVSPAGLLWSGANGLAATPVTP